MGRKKRFWIDLVVALWLAVASLQVTGLADLEMNDDQTEKAFLQWAKDNGAEFEEYLEWPVDFGKSGRGVRARKEIRPLTKFLTLPESLVLNTRNALEIDEKERPLNRLYSTEILAQCRPFDRMVAILLVERALKERSFWFNYLQILPRRSFKNAIIEWTEEDLHELQNEELVEAREVMIQEQAISEATCKQVLEELNLVDFVLSADTTMTFHELYRWAFFVIASRSFQLGDVDEYNLLPVADLMNHHPMSSVSWKVMDGKVQMTLLGSKSVREGMEVYNHYGDLTNDRMLLDYSFISEENFLDVVSVEMPLNTRLLEDKRDVWDGSELDLDHFTNMAHFMEFFRIVSYAEDDLLDRPASFFKNPSSQDRERAAFEMCVKVLKEQVPGSTLLEYDLILQNAIENDPTKERLSMALTYRIARKRIFAQYETFCRDALTRFIDCTPAFDTLVVIKWPNLGRYNRMLQRLSRSKIFPPSWT